MAGRRPRAVRLVVGALAGLEHRALRRAPRRAEAAWESAPPGGDHGTRHVRLRRVGAVITSTHRAAMVQMRRIQVDGHRLRVAIQGAPGAARPLLLLNGIGPNLELPQPFVDALKRIETIRVDLPGAGDSPAPPLPVRFPELARLIARLLDRLEYEGVDILGVSWGGALAQQVAYQHADRCRRLILVSTGTGAIMVPGRLSALLALASPRRDQGAG